jgi:hypothetical protein
MRFVASLILRIDTSYTRIERAKKVDTEGRVDNKQDSKGGHYFQGWGIMTTFFS